LKVLSDSREILQKIFERYHRPEYIDPDPLSRVLKYPLRGDREIAALICSSLALGRVRGILSACDGVLSLLGGPVRENLLGLSRRDVEQLFSRFRYRFFGTEEISAFLWGIRETVRVHGSLEGCFVSGYKGTDETVLPALGLFVGALLREARSSPGILLSDPNKGGAAKRLNLFLRWMIRQDCIDPGGWSGIPRSKLLVPLDTHILRLSSALGFTRRNTGDRKTVLEISSAWRAIDPEDPVRFDFSLSRLGIHPEIANSRNLSAGVGKFFDFLS
jgi:uncharacterized protein (TIGR02757 family)